MEFYFRTIFNIELNGNTAIFQTCGFIPQAVGCGSSTVACVFMQNDDPVNYGRFFEKVIGKCFLQTRMTEKGHERFVDTADTKTEDASSTHNFTLRSAGGAICKNDLKYQMFLHFHCYEGMEVGNYVIIIKNNK